jgi:DNA-binding transcriptional MerR regulator
MSEAKYLKRKDAAALCGCHVDTIRRAEDKGKLANTRRSPDGSVEITLADLVAAGLLDPLAATGSVTEVAPRTRAERDLIEARHELAVERARAETQREQLDQVLGEVSFLRKLINSGRAA